MKRLIEIDDATHAVVPKSPTADMRVAGAFHIGHDFAHNCYSAMIAAAPAVPALASPAPASDEWRIWSIDSLKELRWFVTGITMSSHPHRDAWVQFIDDAITSARTGGDHE